MEKFLHSWDVTAAEARAIQNDLAARVIRSNDFGSIQTIAGADVSLDKEKGLGFGGVIVYSYPKLQEIERTASVVELKFPYIPGLLAFREAPVLLKAFAKLKVKPDLIFFDGQGIAHPRRLGIASHLGLFLDCPTIGCAKSLLIGKYQEPGLSQGSQSDLIDKNEVIGKVLRTRAHVRPIFISLGHRIDLSTAVQFVLSCADGFRIPKPTREADRFVAKVKRDFFNREVLL